MNEEEKKLVDDILTASQQLPPEKRYQLLGVAQGMSMTPGTEEVERCQKQS